MCTSKPKAPKPVAMAPVVNPESIDDLAIAERDRERLRARNRFGRNATILAGAQGGGQPTAPIKTALGG